MSYQKCLAKADVCVKEVHDGHFAFYVGKIPIAVIEPPFCEGAPYVARPMHWNVPVTIHATYQAAENKILEDLGVLDS